MVRVVVIGAAGMLGREVATALAAAGHVVVPTSRRRREGWLTFDARQDDAAWVAEDADLVVNCAAMLAADADRDQEETYAVNAAFPPRLAASGVRLVHISTDAVFRDDAERCFEDDSPDADDTYGASKLAGEPNAPTALTIRCSFVGRDPERARGLVEWLRAAPPHSHVAGFVDQVWNGVVANQVARVCTALADDSVFARARAEGPVHHLFEDPVWTKHELVEQVVAAFALPLTVDARPSGRPVTRVLGTRHSVLVEHLQSGPGRAVSLARLAQRRHSADG
jgi:dTDP-4-dehydrorhamnose reductase